MPKYRMEVVFEAEDDDDAKQQAESAAFEFHSVHSEELTEHESGRTL